MSPALCSLAPHTNLFDSAWDIQQIAGANRGRFILLGPSISDRLTIGSPETGFHEYRAGLSLAGANSVAREGRHRVIAQSNEEAAHEAALSILTRKIGSHPFVVISGPSTSGKTTFARRLGDHLRRCGRPSAYLELDDYFKARSDPTHPRDPNGTLNFESPDSLRLQKLQRDLKLLKDEGRVELPKFDFKTGTYTDMSGRFVQLDKDSVLIIEGIFGLHPIFQSALQIPCFKILIGPWSGQQVGNLYVVPTDQPTDQP